MSFRHAASVLGSDLSMVMEITVERDALGKLDSVISRVVKP